MHEYGTSGGSRFGYLECSAVSSNGFESGNPGRDVQLVGTARFLGEDVAKVHDPVWGVTGSLGDSQCYVGVRGKVAAVQTALSERVRRDDLAVRLIAPAYTIGVSDGQLNGTPGMRFSLIGRELVNESIDLHLNANSMAGLIAVVACDKPPVGTLAAILEHNAPAVLMSDGSIRPGTDPQTGERIDIITGFQVAADPDPATRTRVALHGCPGQGSCGGMFTYNTMQTFIALLGMEPLQMVAPPSDDPRRLKEFPDQLIDCLVAMTDAGITPRDIVTPTSLRNALTVTIAMGGSTNVLLHSVEIARAAGFDLWQDVMSQSEFNDLSRRLPVLVNVRPFGFYSMVDIDAKGGLQAIVKELLEAGLLDGEALTCTGETLGEQVRRLDPPAPDGDVIHPVAKPYKATGGLRLLHGNLAPDGGAVLKIAGIEGGLQDGVFRGRARDLRRRAPADRGARAGPRLVRRSRHGRDPLRGSARGARNARAARPDLAHHRTVPTAQHHDRTDDGRTLLGRVGRARDRSRLPRGVPRRPDRADRGRRRDRHRHQCRPHRLPRARRRQRARAPRAGVAGRERRQQRRPSGRDTGLEPRPYPDADVRTAGAARRRDGDGLAAHTSRGRRGLAIEPHAIVVARVLTAGSLARVVGPRS